MTRCSGTAPLALAGLVALLLPAAGRAQGDRQSLREAITELANNIKKVADKESQMNVRVGRFTPSGLDDANSGDGISAALAQVLGPFASPGAILEVSGVYGFVSGPAGDGIKVIKLRAKMVNTQTLDEVKAFLPLEATVGANPDIAKLLNVTARIDPDGNYTKRNKEIQKSQKEHSVVINGSLVSAHPDSPYAVEVRCKPHRNHERFKAQPRPAQDVNGQAFVPIEKGELYELRLVNRSKQEAAAAITVDGIDVFTFSEDRNAAGRPRFTHFIVPAEGEVKVVGWHKTASPMRKDNFLAFLVTENGHGARARFPQTPQGRVGCITVAFSHAFPPGTARSAGAETGFGPPIEVKQEIVKRVIDPPHEFVTIHYQR